MTNQDFLFARIGVKDVELALVASREAALRAEMEQQKQEAEFKLQAMLEEVAQQKARVVAANLEITGLRQKLIEATAPCLIAGDGIGSEQPSPLPGEHV